MSPKFGDGHSLKRHVPELLAGIIFDVYDPHTQIITEIDVKLNKWNITIETPNYIENQLKENKVLKQIMTR